EGVIPVFKVELLSAETQVALRLFPREREEQSEPRKQTNSDPNRLLIFKIRIVRDAWRRSAGKP
ncbi:MAG: hypothetical protein LVQ95_01235, partial [Candidatus Micrarchaeales archaeon]|nr:hypothetical protein [Candidatus Micrarchaeales archaeon]